MAALEHLLAGAGPDAERASRHLDDVWKSHAFQVFYERPLLLLAALRARALVGERYSPAWMSR